MDNNQNNQSLEKQFKPLYQFFIDAIKDIYWAEQAIENLLKKQKSMALTDELMEAIEDHELQTHKHILRLEKVFKQLNLPAEGKQCEAIAGIIKEGEECIKKTPDKSMTRDAVMIIAAQKIEHYEIASYGGLVQIALTFGLDQVADLLEKTLNEEEETDQLLTDIAEMHINIEAAEESDENAKQNHQDNNELKVLAKSTDDNKKTKQTN